MAENAPPPLASRSNPLPRRLAPVAGATLAVHRPVRARRARGRRFPSGGTTADEAESSSSAAPPGPGLWVPPASPEGSAEAPAPWTPPPSPGGSAEAPPDLPAPSSVETTPTRVVASGTSSPGGSSPMGASALRRMRRSRTSTPQRPGSLQPSGSSTVLLQASHLLRHTAPIPSSPPQRSPSDAGSSLSAPEDVQRQLKHLQLGHKRSALAHTIASRNYRRLHRKFTFYIMLINTIGVVMQQILQGSGASKTVVSIFNSAMFSVVGGLTSINNFLGYGSLEIKHLSMRNEHNAIHDAIADAFAISNERGIQIDWQDILEDVRERERPLAENGVQIPEDILQRFRNMSEEELDTQALG